MNGFPEKRKSNNDILVLDMLNIKPEEWDLDIYKALPEAAIEASLMPDCHRRFINGLLRLYKPKRILEIGVAYGGGSCVILNAMQDEPESKLYSIDLGSKRAHYKNKDKIVPMGCVALDIYGSLIDSGKWTLITGKDPLHCIEKINECFDFCIIDTAHLHPVETLNFLTALPFLNEGAIVVLDDILLYHHVRTPVYAPRFLLSSIVGNKLQIEGDTYNENNIAAVQISDDTWKYVNNIFSQLYLPWMLLSDSIDDMAEYIDRHYGDKHYRSFRKACDLAKSDFIKDYLEIRFSNHDAGMKGFRQRKRDFAYREVKKRVESCLQLTEKIIFIGGGEGLLKKIEQLDLSYLSPFQIWDSHMNTTYVQEIPVVIPDYCALDENYGVIITIEDKSIVKEIVNELSKVNFSNYTHIRDIMQCFKEL